MNQHLIKVCLIVSGLALSVPFVLHAAPPPGGPHHFMGKLGPFDAEHLPPYLQELKLTDEQRAKIGEILKTQGEAMRGQFEAGRKVHHELRKLSFSSEYTEEKAKTLSEEGAKTMSEASLMRARMDHAIYQLLTAEQQKQLNERMENFRARRGGPGGAGFRPEVD